MSVNKILRGNFEPAKQVDVEQQQATLEDQFEREALKRLGGSIAFVSRKKLLWTGEPSDGSGGKD